jgi:hypothetical protein
VWVGFTQTGLDQHLKILKRVGGEEEGEGGEEGDLLLLDQERLVAPGKKRTSTRFFFSWVWGGTTPLYTHLNACMLRHLGHSTPTQAETGCERGREKKKKVDHVLTIEQKRTGTQFSRTRPYSL